MFGFITRRVREFFSVPLPDCREARPKLNELAAELDAITVRVNQHQTSAIDEITGYLRMIYEMMQSGLVDRAADELSYDNFDRYEKLIEKLRDLQLLLEDDARHFIPMNQAVPGQPITDADIFLTDVVIAGIEGRRTMNVQEVKARRHETVLYNGMNQEAVKRMTAHIGRMLITIHDFERVMASR